MSAIYRHAIVVGASSGIGEELVKQLAAGGCKVAALGRRVEKLRQIADGSNGNITPIQHDVTEYDQVAIAFQQAAQTIGGLDLLIYCAGVMPSVGEEEYDFEKDRAMFEVNVLGAMAWLDQAAIRFGNVGSGTIVAIGSVAGERGRAGQPAYNSSKAALATFMESLRNRLNKKGVRVVTIKPGPVDTEMTASLGFKNPMPADKAAALILKKSARTGEHFLSPVHMVIFTVIRNIPSPIFRRMKI